jgi:para-aminobenzoate synthetase/4-amino-4-deoxychorismate lyase
MAPGSGSGVSHGDAGPPLVRFDSLDARRGARSFRFDGFRSIVRADALGEVLPALRAVEEAVAGGAYAAGFVPYEAAPAFDPALATRPPDPRLPLLWFALFDRRIEADLEELSGDGDASLGALRPDVAEADYAAGVERIRDLIAAGDTYQVNYTFRLRAALSEAEVREGGLRAVVAATSVASSTPQPSSLALYRRLCQAQQAAFCAYLDFGDGVIVSASPELFFRWEGGELELRPMKGTRPRGRWLEEDRELARELAASPKDRAENLMIVDLLRNDAGRVAEFGSVRVERMFEVEPYPTVLQMTSTVRARTRGDTTLTDIFRALFPCGSITGAPKVRTSQIIAELETSPRGVYTGAIGFVSPGEAVFSVAIRTLLVDRATGEAELGVGSGVTYDSAPADEYRECLSKAAFVRHAPPPSLIETFGWTPATGFARLDGHLERMSRSAAYFGYAFDADALRSRLDALAAELPPEPRRVRVELSPRGEVAVEHAPAPRWEEPVRLAIASRHGDSAHPFWYHKIADRARYDAHDPVAVPHDLVLLVNERGELTETPISNLVVELDGALWTPDLDAGLLPGVLRAELLRDGTIRERVLAPEDLHRATAVWVINSLRGWGRAIVVSVDGDPVAASRGA